MPIKIQSAIYPALQDRLDDKVNSAELGQRVAFYSSRAAVTEMIEDSLLRYLFDNDVEKLEIIDEERDIDPISLVSCPGMGDLVERELDPLSLSLARHLHHAY